MPQRRAMDILDHARAFYGTLSDYFERLTHVTDKERIRMLLLYLVESERARGNALLEYERTAPVDLMDTWFKCGPDKADGSCFNPDALLADMDVDEVIQEAIRLENCLSALYSEMADRAQTDEVRELFETLLRSNEKHIRNLVRDAEQLRDL